ncbi:MAG: hypothetical protein E7264_07990 [Lachnospiraceae bacterium]|nr:hypothetical protein [Lachnospiraceae bacterium]
MKNVKTNKPGRRILSIVLTVVLMVGLMPGNMLTVSAEESNSTELSVTAFATPEQLMSSFDLDGTDDTVGKVYFGTSGENPLKWYIAGKDSAQETDNIVLFSAQSLGNSEFGSNSTYAGSTLADTIKGYEYAGNSLTSKFTAAEDSLMLSTRLANKPPNGGSAKLYALNQRDMFTKYITAGEKDDIKIDISYWGNNFWLRASSDNDYAYVAYRGTFVFHDAVNNVYPVVPAFDLNLSSVLFASTAPAATSGANLTDTMTFRVDGAETDNEKITSKATYTTDSVMVDASDSETVYLYVAGNDGTTDWVYSQEVSTDSTIAIETIMSGAKDSSGMAVTPASVDLSRCRIWIEKKVAEDNLVYAVMAREAITSVEVMDITVPVAGTALDVAATCNTTGVSTTTPNVSYTKNGESVSGNAGAYASYTAIVELEAADGYVFTDETTAAVNGKEASVSYDADTGKIAVSYTFDKTAKLPLGNTYFATVDELMGSFDLDGTDDTVGKVYFGTNTTGNSTVPQTWYIAGSDADNSIVLLCDPELPLAETVFEDDCGMNKTYDNSWNCTYETAPSWVYPNHYGASDLRGVLQGYTGNDNTEKFSAAEKELMQTTRIYTDDQKQKDDGSAEYTYYTEDKLYVAYGDDNDNQYITVGANSADSLNGGLKVSLTSAPYTNGGLFWLRATYAGYSSRALVAFPELYVDFRIVDVDLSVVPAFRLNLSSVLFASAAPAAISGTSLTDTMTFRLAGDDKITGNVYYSTDSVVVDVADEEPVYLYVQGNDGTTDWVYSKEISADDTITASDIKNGAKDRDAAAAGLTNIDLSRCRIWIEKKVAEDNLVYAVMAKEAITSVEVMDITAPVAGTALDVAATCNTTGVSTTTPTVSYTKKGGSVSGKARYLADYTATVELEAVVGYAFTNETTATINGKEASVFYDADTGKLTVSYTFDKTAKLPLGNAYYVTKDELMSSFDLDGMDDTVGKVYFGTNGSNKQTWYIAGSDAADSIVLLCDPSLPMATGTMFENDKENNKTYSADWNCTYETAPNEVYPNHYGASDLRGVLQEYTSNDNTEKFSAAEKELMQSTKVYTDDDKRKDESKTDYTYYTEDVLYPAYGDYYDDQYITVGANSAESLNGGLKVSLQSAPYNSGDKFWLRAPNYDFRDGALAASPDICVLIYNVNREHSVVPAFNLNLSSVLFASAAPAVTSGVSLTDTMTFRVDGTKKLASKAAYTTGGVTVNYDEDDGNVFLYVQDADSVYSVEITKDTTVLLSDMTGISSLTDENTKIWLEKSEDNVTYAVITEDMPNFAEAGIQSHTLTYNSLPQTPAFIVKLGNIILTADDYDVTVTEQKDVGDYTATITGKGIYEGTIENVAWSIRKATPTLAWNNQTIASTGKEAVITEPTLTFAGTDKPEVELAYSYKAQGDEEYTVGLPSACGTYDLKVNVPELTNYAAVEKIITLTITCTDADNNGICDHCGSYDEPEHEDEYYQIANAGNLIWFVQQVNEGQTAINAKLTADINLKGIDWTTMENFAGTFDGNGYTISGLNGHKSYTPNTHGFIRTLANGAVVKNLIFTEADIFNHEGNGAISAVIVYTNNGTVENCVVKNSLIQHGNYDALGVVVGVNGGTIRNCASISNTMKRRHEGVNNKAACGFVWSNGTNATIENCMVYDCTYVEALGNYAFTGINKGTINNCYYYESSETLEAAAGTAKTADQFASGEVAYLLNDSKTDGTQSWYQTLGNTEDETADKYPVLSNTHKTVYSYGGYYANAFTTDEAGNISTERDDKIGTVTLDDTNATYDGTEKAPVVTVTIGTGVNKVTFAKDTHYTVIYPADMTNAGEKTITIAMKEKSGLEGTVKLKFMIKKKAPTLADFVFSAPEDLTYSAVAKSATVKAKDGIKGMGAITVSYTDSNGETVSPVKVNEEEKPYVAVINVAEGDNYEAFESTYIDTKAAGWTFHITKKAAKDVATPVIENSIIYGTKLSAVTLPDGWEWQLPDTVPAIENNGFEASYAILDDVNYDYSAIDGYDAEKHAIVRTVAVTVTKVCKHDGKTEVKDAKKATCAVDGYTGDTYCKDCGVKIATGTKIDKSTAHTWDNGVVTKEATATEKGEKTYTCSVCKTTKKEEIPVIIDKSEDTTAPMDYDSAEDTDKIITSANTDKGDVKGSGFAKLQLKAIGKNKAVNLTWKKVKDADGYIVYGAQCNKKLEKLETLTVASKVKYTHKKLKKAKYYKYMVVAYKTIDGKDYTIATSKSVHTVTNGGKYANPTKVTVKSAKLTVKKGSKKTIKASLKLPKNKKLKTHIAKFRYESDNTKVATVTKKGVVKGMKKGTANIYVYAQNGVYKKVKVNVK